MTTQIADERGAENVGCALAHHPVDNAKWCAEAHTTGCGRVELKKIGARTVVTRRIASSPLKLLSPRTCGESAWIFTSTYGGGLVGGDDISLSVRAGPSTRSLLSTQASTKIYRTSGLPCRQQLDANISDDAILVSLPDPLVCFAGSNYRQQQRFDLAGGAGLVMVDALTSGRRARGERWAFDRYESHCEIHAEDRCIFRDAILLDPMDGPLLQPARMGMCDCFASMVIVGKPLERVAKELIGYIQSQPMTTNGTILFAASPIAGGVVCRVAGSETEAVMRWIHERLAFVSSLLGQDPWRRKW